MMQAAPAAAVAHITSRGNPLLTAIRRSLRDSAGYRRHGQVWIEGDHLCGAALARGWPIAQAMLSDAAWRRGGHAELVRAARRTAVVPAALFAELSALESPSSVGCLIELPAAAAIDSSASAVVLDRVQDAGNVGSILRSAAALGVPQVLALKGTAALWSPKVLRAGMGAHFALRLCEGLDEAELRASQLPLVATSSHGGVPLPEAALPRPCGWLFGHEGQGVAPSLLAHCSLTVGIPQPGGEESLNVAAAAAICLYEALRQGQ